MPSFFEQPILNSPYEYPCRHWELDQDRQPTDRPIEIRREASFITPVPKPRKRRRGQRQLEFDVDAAAVGTANQQYQLAHVINGVRRQDLVTPLLSREAAAADWLARAGGTALRLNEVPRRRRAASSHE